MQKHSAANNVIKRYVLVDDDDDKKVCEKKTVIELKVHHVLKFSLIFSLRKHFFRWFFFQIHVAQLLLVGTFSSLLLFHLEFE